jgi:cell division protein FtsZ
MTLAEANSVAKKISEKMDVNNSMVIWGARVNDEFDGYLRVMLLITGIKSPQIFGKDSSILPVRTQNKQKLGLSDEIFNLGEIAFD